jgi:hypothetical protein
MAKTRNLEGMSSARVSILILTVSMNLAQSLRSMDHSRYLLLATEMYTTLLSRLHLVQRIGDALSQMLERDE